MKIKKKKVVYIMAGISLVFLVCYYLGRPTDYNSISGVLRIKKIIEFLQVHKYQYIGKEYSGITTTLGSYHSKLISSSPEFIKIIYRLYQDAGIQKGDKIAINTTGSFPLINIAALVTAEIMGAVPIMISSFCSSSYGANQEDTTYQDIEFLLYQKGLIKYRSVAFSIGGENDKGDNLVFAHNPDQISKIIKRLKNQGFIFINSKTLNHGLNQRIAIWKKHHIKLFVNIGGNQTTFGKKYINIGSGLIENGTNDFNRDSLFYYFHSRKCKMINILNIKDMIAVNYF